VRRLFRAIGLAMFALLAVATIAALFALRGSLAQLDGTVTEDVLTAPVRVDRDERGTATFHAENRRDLEFALGYVHAL
jgi:penicillin amidase